MVQMSFKHGKSNKDGTHTGSLRNMHLLGEKKKKMPTESSPGFHSSFWTNLLGFLENLEFPTAWKHNSFPSFISRALEVYHTQGT